MDTIVVEPADDHPRGLRRIGGGAGLEAVAFNRLRAIPGEWVPPSYYYHAE